MIVITKILIKGVKYNISVNILELIDLLWSTNLKSKSKQKSLKYQENSKKQLYNVGILDSRWEEADFRKKSKKKFWNAVDSFSSWFYRLLSSKFRYL